MVNDLYREEILEHYREPLNFGRLKKFNKSSKQLNPFCGDEVEIFLKFTSSSAGVHTNPPLGWTVKDIGFLGRGCAISMASASILTEYVKGKTKDQLTSFGEKDMLGLLRIKVSETRKKCALLALAVLKDCLIQ